MIASTSAVIAGKVAGKNEQLIPAQHVTIRFLPDAQRFGQPSSAGIRRSLRLLAASRSVTSEYRTVVFDQ